MVKSIMAIDPSGNFDYDKGHTGIAYIDGNDIIYTTICADKFETKKEYYEAILKYITQQKFEHTIIENFILQGKSAWFLANKPAETTQLIEWLKSKLTDTEITIQPNSIISRWPDRVLRLELKEVLKWDMPKRLTAHEKDALRHLINYYMKANDLFNG